MIPFYWYWCPPCLLGAAVERTTGMRLILKVLERVLDMGIDVSPDI